MTVVSLLEGAAHFAHLAHDWPKATHAALEVAAQIVEAKAKAAIGTYKYGWPQLADSTQEDRAHKGFPANEPLLRTGELRDSIQHSSNEKEAHIGSNLDRAVWMELGTSRMPPRPFLAPSVFQNEALIKRAVKQVIRDYMTQSRMDFDFYKAAFHALHKIWEELKDLAPEDPDADKRRR
jgi:HK97 gp10 family phage protein